MKRCPKCNRTFPDESQKFCTVDGGLLIAEQPFDPNATIRATSAELGIQKPAPSPSDVAPTSRELPPLPASAGSEGATYALPPRNTAPTGSATSADLKPAQVEGFSTLPGSTPRPEQPKKKSKLPLILGILAVLLVLGVGGAVAAFFLVIKPRLEGFQDRPEVTREAPEAPTPAVTDTATPTPEASPSVEEFVPPADATKFMSSKDNLDGRLADHYLDFSFYYPKSWQTDPRAGGSGSNNFVKVERRLPPDFTQENFAVGWYQSKGTFASDESAFPQLVERLSAGLSKIFPEYRKVSEGPTKVNSLDGYEFRFVSFSKGTEKGDLQLWGRVIFLPAGEGQPNGATLSMLATSLAPELSGVQDVGEKGEMPLILESFRFVKN